MSKAEQFVAGWLRHREVTVELVDMISDDSLDFKPWEGAMTLGELVTHIVNSATWFSSAIKNGQMTKPPEKPQITSMAQLKQYVHDATAEAKATLLSLTDEQLETVLDTTKIFGAQLPGKMLLAGMRDHEIHHKGQLFVYARMTGVENPPSFVKTSR